MKKDIQISYEYFKNSSELSDIENKLFERAKEARENAYAPYSQFLVGCSVLLENGEIYSGNNQENAAYPSGLCAERTAIFYAGANYPDAKIVTMAISAASDNNQTLAPIPPCGACRQSIAEYEFRQDYPIEIYFMGEKGSRSFTACTFTTSSFILEK